MDLWTSLGLILLTLFIVYVLVDLLYIRKHPRSKFNSERLMNLCLAVGIIAFISIGVILMSDGLGSKNPMIIFLDNIIIKNLVPICTLLLATTGIVIIFKTSFTTNFAQGSMATFGAYVSAVLISDFIKKFGLDAMTSFILALLAGMITSFIIGLIIDVVIIRNARYVTSVGKQMITMGLVLVLSGMVPMVFGVIPISIPRFSTKYQTFELLGSMITIPEHTIFSFVVTVALLSTLFIALKYTKWGLGVRATASNETIAGMMGVNTHLITAMSWAIAGALGAAAAVIFAPTQGSITGGLMIPMQVNGFLASILGGFSSFGGPIVGVLLINFLTAMITFFNSQWVSVIVYSIIFLLVLLKPIGLFGKKVSKKV